MAKTTKLFDRHFSGKSNAGIRKLIRDTADSWMPACGPVIEKGIRSACSGVALTAGGHATLEKVIADYRSVRPDYDGRCSCDSCVAGTMQGLAR